MTLDDFEDFLFDAEKELATLIVEILNKLFSKEFPDEYIVRVFKDIIELAKTGSTDTTVIEVRVASMIRGEFTPRSKGVL